MKDLPPSILFITFAHFSSFHLDQLIHEHFQFQLEQRRRRKRTIFVSHPFSRWCENESYRSYLQRERKRNLVVDKDRPGEAESRRQKKRKRGREGSELIEREKEREAKERRWRHGTTTEAFSPPRIFPCFVSPRRDTFQSRNLKLVNYLTIVVSQPPTFAVHPRVSVPDNREGVLLHRGGHFPEIFRFISDRVDRERWLYIYRKLLK